MCANPRASHGGGRIRPYGARMVTATTLALVLANPVGGGVASGFDVAANPFAPGQHRGADFAAAPGDAVRAACGGRVVVAGRVGSSGRLVTVRCGRWRVTHMPMEAVVVRAGAVIRRGARLGRVARSDDHAGLHLGVRREGRRFGYVDPLRFLAADPPVPPPAAAPTRIRRAPPPAQPVARRPALRVVTRPHIPRVVARRFAPRRVVATPAPLTAHRTSGARPLAPWPAWAGLALVLAGAGLRWRRPPAASLRRPRWRSTSPPRSTT